MASPVIQFKRGAFASLPALKAGEPAFTNDKYDLYIGLDNNAGNNKFFGSHRYWLKETTTAGSGVNLVEGTNNGVHSFTMKAPAALAASYNVTFPNAQGANSAILQNNGSGVLSWTAAPTFTGALTISDTTDSTNKDTGAIICEGGVGVEKSVHVGAALSVTDRLYVGGQSEFIGIATFRGGTVRLGDSDTDDVVVGGEFASNLVPTTSVAYDLGTSAKKWRDLHAANLNVGIITATTIEGFSHLIAPHSATATTIIVTVATKTAAHRYNGSGSSSGYVLDGIQSPFLTLTPGRTYKFDTSHSTNNGHPFLFYLDSGKTHAYTTNVTTNGTAGSAGAYTQIVVGDATPDVLHYQCSAHSLMGNAVTTSSNGIDTPHAASFRGNVDLGDATGDTITATGRFDSDLVPSTDGARDLGASGLEWKDLYVDGTANIDALVADTAIVADLTDNRVVIAGSGGELEDSGNLTFDGTTLAVTGKETVSVDITVGSGVTIQGHGGVSIAGIVTANGGVKVGTAVSIHANGNLGITGIATADRFIGIHTSADGGGIGIGSTTAHVGYGITYIDFKGPGVSTVYSSSVTGITTIYFQGGGGDSVGAAGTWQNDGSQGISTAKSVGINTVGIAVTALQGGEKGASSGIGVTFQGLYISNGMMVNDNQLNGNHYIGTAFGGIMAGPVTVNGVVTVDGNWAVV